MATEPQVRWRPRSLARLMAGRRASLWLLVGLACSLAGQLLFHLRVSVLDGLLLYGAGLLLAWRWARLGAEPEPRFTLGGAPAGPLHRRSWLLMAGAGVLTALAVLFTVAPEVRSLPVQALVLAAGVLWVAAARASEGVPGAAAAVPRPPLSRWHWAALGTTLAVAAVLRLWDLAGLPEGLWYDEARIGLEAWRLLTDAEFRPVYSEGTTTPAAYVYLVSWSEALFGKTVLGVRLVSALSGVASTLLMYLAARRAFGPRVALLASALFATARWDVNFSRIAMQGATTPTLTLLAMWAGLGALATGRRWQYALLGVAMGALPWFYTSNLFFLLVPLAVAAGLALHQPRALAGHRDGLALTAGGALVVALPVLAATLAAPDRVLDRPQQASVFATTAPEQLLPTLWTSALKHVAMLHVSGDANGRHNLPMAPMLDPVTAAFLTLGAVVALRRWRDVRYLALLAWLPAMLLPGVLSVAFEAPQALRAIGTIVPAVLLAALGLAAVTERLRPQTAGPAALAMVALAGAFNTATYFGMQRADPRVWQEFSMGATLLARYALQAPADYRVYGSVHYSAHPTVQFLTGGPVETLDPDRHLPVAEGGAVLFFAAEEAVYYALAAAYYPDGACQPLTRTTPDRAVAFVCTVSPEAVAGTRGLAVTLTPVAGGEARRTVAETAEVLTPAASAGWDLALAGSLHAPEEGTYRLQLQAPASLTLHVDGRQVALGGGGTGAVTLARGLHAIEVRGRTPPATSTVRVLWATPGTEALTPIPAERLFRGDVRPMGLTVTYRPGEDAAAVPAMQRIEPSPYVYYHVPPLPLPFNGEWTGSLTVPVAGPYGFQVAGVTSAVLEVDGVPVAAVGAAPGPEGTVMLPQGLHRVRIRNLVAGPYGHIYVQWRMPGAQVFERIPPQMLRPW